MFQQLTEKYAQERDGFILSEIELAELTLAAKDSHDVHPAVWAKFKAVLTKNAGLKATAVASEYRECRITSDLGTYPYSVEEFVPAFLFSRGFKMNFGGEFGNDNDADFILNKMNQWSHEIIGGRPIYPENLIRGAFSNWQAIERTRLMKAGFAKVQFDVDADKGEGAILAVRALEPADALVPVAQIQIEAMLGRISYSRRGLASVRVAVALPIRRPTNVAVCFYHVSFSDSGVASCEDHAMNWRTRIEPFTRPLFFAYSRMTRGMTLGVRAVAVDDQGRVCLIKHTYVVGWWLPGGGVDRGETTQAAVVRELREEAGLIATVPPRLISIHSNERYFPGDHVAVFAVDAFTMEERTSHGEIAEIGWFAPDALPGDAHRSTRARLAEIFGGAAATEVW